jgi:hypothetical protein
MSTNTDRAARMTHEDKLKLVPELVKKLKSGTTFSQIRRDPAYPSSGLRKALAASGYNTRGEAIEKPVTATKASGKALAKRVATARAAGSAWWRLELETGKRTRELKKLLSEHGFEA